MTIPHTFTKDSCLRPRRLHAAATFGLAALLGACRGDKTVDPSLAPPSTSNNVSKPVGGGGGTPVLTMQPQSVTVIAGQTATLTVTASGRKPITYQWRKNGSDLAGATAASYTTPPVTRADSGATFVVVVTNTAGSVTSQAAGLTVPPLPAPVMLGASSPACSQINIAWTPPNQSGAGVARYVLYRDGTPFRSVLASATRFSDIGVLASTAHTYAVQAVDDRGVASAQSAVVQAATGACPAGVYYCGIQPDGSTIPCGTVYLDAVTDAVSGRDRIVGYRTKFRVDLNARPPFQTNAQDWKIVFNFLAFYNPAGPAGANETSIQAANLWSDRTPWEGNTCNQLPTTSLREADFRLAVTDHFGDHRFGLKSLDPVIATSSWEIDGIRGLWQRSAVLSQNLNGKDVAFELTRGEVTTDVTDWACPQWTIPSDSYRVWYGTVTVDGISYRMAALLPEARARYMRPAVTAQLGTENFSLSPGPFRGYYWDVEVQTEVSTAWQPLDTWRVPVADYGPQFFGYGFRLGTYNGHSVIEASQDGTNTYLSVGQTLVLRP